MSDIGLACEGTVRYAEGILMHGLEMVSNVLSREDTVVFSKSGVRGIWCKKD